MTEITRALRDASRHFKNFADLTGRFFYVDLSGRWNATSVTHDVALAIARKRHGKPFAHEVKVGRIRAPAPYSIPVSLIR